MQQLHIEEEKLVPIDYEDKQLPAHVRNFRPAIFQDNELYYCLLGPSLEEGVAGSGITVEEAIQAWTEALKERISNPPEGDTVAREILDDLSISKKDVW